VAVPNPRSWGASLFVDSTIANLEWRDTFNFLLQPPRAFAYRSAALTLTTAVWTLVPLDAEIYDPYSTPMHDNSTNPSRMIAPETGLYVVNLKIGFSANATGNRLMELRKNAAGSQVAGTLVTTQATAGIATNSIFINETVEVQLNATDYVELFAQQGSGGNLGLTVGSAQTILQMRFVTKQ